MKAWLLLFVLALVSAVFGSTKMPVDTLVKSSLNLEESALSLDSASIELDGLSVDYVATLGLNKAVVNSNSIYAWKTTDQNTLTYSNLVKLPKNRPKFLVNPLLAYETNILSPAKRSDCGVYTTSMERAGMASTPYSR